MESCLYKYQSLPKFLDCRLIFFTSDGQFLACAAKFRSRKYYKSGSISDIGHFDHATGWEVAHNS